MVLVSMAARWSTVCFGLPGATTASLMSVGRKRGASARTCTWATRPTSKGPGPGRGGGTGEQGGGAGTGVATLGAVGVGTVVGVVGQGHPARPVATRPGAHGEVQVLAGQRDAVGPGDPDGPVADDGLREAGQAGVTVGCDGDPGLGRGRGHPA